MKRKSKQRWSTIPPISTKKQSPLTLTHWTREKVGNDAIWLLSWYRLEYAALYTFLTLRNNYVEWYGYNTPEYGHMSHYYKSHVCLSYYYRSLLLLL